MKKKIGKIKKRHLKAEDLHRLNIINEVTIAPDEKRVAYTIENVSDDKKKYFSRIFIVNCETHQSRQYTFGEANDRNPVWSPDGNYIAFISTRNKKSGIYIIPVGGGGEKKIIEEDGAFAGLVWTPDGKSLVYAFRYNDNHLEKDEKKKKEAPLYRHITRVFYRLDGSGFVPRDRFHIWKLDIDSGKSEQLTKGKYDDHSPCVSSDGRRIVFISNRSRNPDVDWLRDDLFVIPSNGSRVSKIKTPAGPVASPAFSPDGKKIAYIGHANPNDPWGVENMHVWTVGSAGRPAARDMIPKFDRQTIDSTLGDIGEGMEAPPLHWSSDSKRIYFSASDTGSTHIFYVSSKGGLPTRVTNKKCHIKAYSLNGKRKRIAAVFSDLIVPTELHTIPSIYNGDSKTSKTIRPDRELLSEIDLPKTREVWFKAHDGTELQGWLTTPPRFNRNRKYPAILEIHGGPRTQYGFTFYHEILWLASKGYVVFYTNPRGGVGRGETFADAISGGWGEIDHADCMAATDYMEKLPFVNKMRIGVTGGSYGGYMTNWIVGHTDRFKAAVTQRSVVNLESFFGSSDIGYTLSREFNGHPWQNRENYKKCSPLTYAKNIKTPLLIIHSENDLRCGIEQAEELFATLKLMRKKVEFVRFPEEPHGLCRHGRPDRRIARLEWILKWFDRYLK
jgi:dipeptidyl aminopeptidase/acylaminoacyl peptidase